MRPYLLLSVAVLTAIALTGCEVEGSVGADGLNVAKLEKQLDAELQEPKAKVKLSTDCPKAVELKQGDIFECRIEKGDGEAVGAAHVKQTDADGSVTWEVVFFARAAGLEEGVRSAAKDGTTVASVTCPDGVELAKGVEFECIVDTGDGEQRVAMTMDDDEGNFTVGTSFEK